MGEVTALAPLARRAGSPRAIRIDAWHREWGTWRAAAGRPETEHAGFHALRHFFATMLIANGAEPQDVQRALRHKSLSLTLETYVGVADAHQVERRDRRRAHGRAQEPRSKLRFTRGLPGDLGAYGTAGQGED